MSIGGFSPIMPSSSQDAKAHERKVESNQRGVDAQGINADDKESEASSGDRDADGRQAWQWTQRQGRQQDDSKERNAPDLTGNSGSNLDLSG